MVGLIVGVNLGFKADHATASVATVDASPPAFCEKDKRTSSFRPRNRRRFDLTDQSWTATALEPVVYVRRARWSPVPGLLS